MHDIIFEGIDKQDITCHIKKMHDEISELSKLYATLVTINVTELLFWNF